MALGEFEQLILFALARRGGEAASVEIGIEIETGAGRVVSPGAVYTALERMEARGLIESWIGDATPARGGRRRREYRLLPAGARQLRESHDTMKRMASGTSATLARLAADRGR
jgi:DNA-binding PadR family transcriptional regulator